jgi:heme-degrading monooxygenase HmoA
MSVLVTVRVSGDTDRFREFLSTEADRLNPISEEAKGVGCLHHRFTVGDGFVLVVDEWESAEQFQQFFESNEEIPKVIQDSGGQGPPEVTIAEAVETPDQF